MTRSLTVSPGASIARPPSRDGSVCSAVAGSAYVAGVSWSAECARPDVGMIACGSVGWVAARLVNAPLVRSRSALRASVTVHRFSGSFSSRPINTGVSTPARVAGAGWSSTMARIVSNGSPRSNGGRPSTAV